jgi:hypothetical protein
MATTAAKTQQALPHATPGRTELAAAARELLHFVQVAPRPHHLPCGLAVAAALLAL